MQDRDLQQPIEEAFLSKSNCCSFRISDQVYKLYLSTSEMHQENVKYGTRKEVRRRPADFKSRADIQQLKRCARNTDIAMNNLKSHSYCSSSTRETHMPVITSIWSLQSLPSLPSIQKKLSDLYDNQFWSRPRQGVLQNKTYIPNKALIKQRRTELK